MLTNHREKRIIIGKMKTTLTAILALAAGAALAEGDLTVSAWILPRGLVPGAPIVVATSDAEARSGGAQRLRLHTPLE